MFKSPGALLTRHEWLLAHFSLFRLALFFCCFAYWIVGLNWFKPRRSEIRAGIMAAWVQLSLGVLLDAQVVRLGCWRYREMPFSIATVPLDLHLDWALVWGFFLVWLYSRLRKYWQGRAFISVYLLTWSALTLAFDAVVARQMLFLQEASKWWWAADLVFLLGVQTCTLWVYHGILFLPERRSRAVWNCRVRSVLYVSSLAYLFYWYLPSVILSLTNGWSVPPALGLGTWPVLAVLLIPPFLLGAWATLAFTDGGLGTPIPLDPPRRLVTCGPYAYVRNPMQVAGILLAVELVIYHPTLFVAIYALDMVVMSAVLLHLFETAELERQWSSAFAEYRKHVRDWVPRLTPYHGGMPSPAWTFGLPAVPFPMTRRQQPPRSTGRRRLEVVGDRFPDGDIVEECLAGKTSVRPAANRQRHAQDDDITRGEPCALETEVRSDR